MTSMPAPVLRIKRGVSGPCAILLLLCLLAVVAICTVLAAASRLLPFPEEGLFGLLKCLFILALLLWVFVAGIVHAFTRVLFWLELGEDIRYRTLLGVRRLPWAAVADFDLELSERPNSGLEERLLELFVKHLLKWKGRLLITTVEGGKLELSLTFSEWEAVKQLGRHQWRPFRPRVQLSFVRATGFIGLGLSAMLVGVYADYLLWCGKWMEAIDPYLHDPRGIAAWAALPFVIPVGGAAVLVYGVSHLRRKGPARR